MWISTKKKTSFFFNVHISTIWMNVVFTLLHSILNVVYAHIYKLEACACFSNDEILNYIRCLVSFFFVFFIRFFFVQFKFY